MQISHLLSKHGLKIAIASLIGGSLLLSFKPIVSLGKQRANEKVQTAIALTRYKLGCRIVVAVNSSNNFVPLVEGEPIIDGATGTLLSAGTVVCDSQGNTAQIVKNTKGEPVVGEVAVLQK